ncbi:putative homing endonuclease [Vibrio phage 424E50-1]|nr:putative homing endonuclease [Vibrio phage 424E50-1]
MALGGYIKYLNKPYKTVHGNTLTPVRYFTEKNKGRYVLECSVCSKDSELFPPETIITSVDSVNKSRGVCGCNVKYKYKEFQYNVLIDRRCKDLGYQYLGYDTEYLGCLKTKLKLYNPITDNTWNTTSIDTFLRVGVRDPEEFNRRRGDTFTLPDQYHIDNFTATGKFKKGTVFTRKDTNKWVYSCPVCSEDEYVKGGVCSGVFSASQGHLANGKLSCRCSKYKWTKEQRVYQINKIMDTGVGKFLHWDEDFKGRRTKFHWICSHGHENLTGINPFFKWSNCKTCSANGFKNHLPAYLYLTKRSDESISAIKYGITNISVESREKSQNKGSNLSPEVLHVFYHEEGKVIEECEKKIKKEVGSYYCTKEQLPNGFSETVKYSKDNLSKMLEIISSFGIEPL